MYNIQVTIGSFLLLITVALGTSAGWHQASQCAPTDSPRLRFVAQLSVSGCALFVHEIEASDDGPHFVVEPVMCVTDSLRSARPRLDPVSQQMYVSVPVVLRDDSMLEEAWRQLQHLSPRSVTFANVKSVCASAQVNSSVYSIGFIWNSDETIGQLRIGSKTDDSGFDLVSEIRISPIEILERTRLTAEIELHGRSKRMVYHPQIQNSSFVQLNMLRSRYRVLTSCRTQLRFVRSVNLVNCTARVHQRLDVKGHFLIEPLLCHNVSSLSSESVGYDYSREMYYIKLDLVLQDDASLDAVTTQLADLVPRSVAFMQLWHAESIASSLLSARYEISPLMVTADWRSAQLRILCRNLRLCSGLRFALQSQPADLWQNLKWKITSLVSNSCMLFSDREFYSWRLKALDGSVECSSYNSCRNVIRQVRAGSVPYQAFHSTSDGRWFLSIQQRVAGSVSFQRAWTEYEKGFGDETDFWIGLSAIHSLSAGGATLRLEMKLWNGTELHAEYAGFQVGDASSKYVMTYRAMLRDRSTVNWDAMEHSHGSQFSTIDSDNDNRRGESCSVGFGKGGWWFNGCMHFNPNGVYPTSSTSEDAFMSWYSRRHWVALKEVRLMLQI